MAASRLTVLSVYWLEYSLLLENHHTVSLGDCHPGNAGHSCGTHDVKPSYVECILQDSQAGYQKRPLCGGETGKTRKIKTPKLFSLDTFTGSWVWRTHLQE